MKIRSIKYSGKADVYNMEVEDTHDYVVDGGIVAHNCADAIRYMLMERPLGNKVKPEQKIIKPFDPLGR